MPGNKVFNSLSTSPSISNLGAEFNNLVETMLRTSKIAKPEILKSFETQFNQLKKSLSGIEYDRKFNYTKLKENIDKILPLENDLIQVFKGRTTIAERDIPQRLGIFRLLESISFEIGEVVIQIGKMNPAKKSSIPAKLPPRPKKK
jgi:hypothetical protein